MSCQPRNCFGHAILRWRQPIRLRVSDNLSELRDTFAPVLFHLITSWIAGAEKI